jgi:hypothetical protein
VADRGHQQNYLEQLGTGLLTRNVSAELVRHILAEVEAHLEATGQDPVEAFGDPRRFAEEMEARLEAGGRDPAKAFDEPRSFAEKAEARLDALSASTPHLSEETLGSCRAQMRAREPKTLAGKALRGTLSLLRFLLALVLQVLFLGVGLLYGVFCGIWVAWSGLRALTGIGTGEGEPWHLPVGLVMIVLGLLLLFLMKPVIKRLTGRTISDGGQGYT